jgi:hypothetical protein
MSAEYLAEAIEKHASIESVASGRWSSFSPRSTSCLELSLRKESYRLPFCAWAEKANADMTVSVHMVKRRYSLECFIFCKVNNKCCGGKNSIG